MIPHHAGASKMCEVYENATKMHDQQKRNPDICCGDMSLCYNITYGAKSWGEWQYDFSQPGEIEQMEHVLRHTDMYLHFLQRCKCTKNEHGHEHRSLGMNMGMDNSMDMDHGCGELD